MPERMLKEVPEKIPKAISGRIIEGIPAGISGIIREKPL